MSKSKAWRTSRSSDVVNQVYSNRAKVEVILSGGVNKRLVFPRGGRVIVGGGGTSHYSKPHRTITI